MTSERDDLHTWADGRLEGERRQRFEARLQVDRALRDEAHAWRRQADALRELGRDALDEPVPQRLIDAARGRSGACAAPYRGRDAERPDLLAAAPRIWLATTAFAAMAWSAGWMSHWYYATTIDPRTQAAPPGFVRDAVAAHVVYTREDRHPVEVAAAQREHLVTWLSKRLNARLTVPSLDAHGWSLIGGRLLPGADAARAQFMYQDAAGARLTLYVAEAGAQAGHAAFRFGQDGRIATLYWVDGRFGYTLSAHADRAALRSLAEEVHRQVTGPSRSPA